MNLLAQLDALCLPQIVADAPVTVGFGGSDYTGTSGARDTMRSLTEGGHINDQEFALLFQCSAFGSATPPTEREKVTVCVDANGIPCAAEDSTSRINARVRSIGRAGAGLTYTLQSEAR
jgi:hypothetical protein